MTTLMEYAEYLVAKFKEDEKQQEAAFLAWKAEQGSIRTTYLKR